MHQIYNPASKGTSSFSFSASKEQIKLQILHLLQLQTHVLKLAQCSACAASQLSPAHPQRPPTPLSSHSTGEHMACWRKAQPVGHLMVSLSPPRSGLSPARSATLQQDLKKPPGRSLGPSHIHHHCHNIAASLGAREGEQRDKSLTVPQWRG